MKRSLRVAEILTPPCEETFGFSDATRDLEPIVRCQVCTRPRSSRSWVSGRRRNARTAFGIPPLSAVYQGAVGSGDVVVRGGRGRVSVLSAAMIAAAMPRRVFPKGPVLAPVYWESRIKVLIGEEDAFEHGPHTLLLPRWNVISSYRRVISCVFGVRPQTGQLLIPTRHS